MSQVKTAEELSQMYFDLIRKYSSGNNKWSHEREVESFRFIIEVAAYIHNIKSLTYKDSWKKRGWQVSVFGNLSRKFDRLDAIFTDPSKFLNLFEKFNVNDVSESVADTFIDLGNYCFLAMTEILFTKDKMMLKFLNSSGIKVDVADDVLSISKDFNKNQSKNLD